MENQLLSMNKSNFIMFHYVKPKTENEFRYLNSVDLKDLEHFIDLNFKNIITFQELINLKNLKNTKKIILTFDDGLSDHFDYVFPLLKRKQISGIFFINPDFAINGLKQKTHKLHYLYGKYGWEEILKHSKSYINFEDFISYEEISKKVYPLDLPEISLLKYLINFLFEEKKSNLVLSKISQKLKIDFSKIRFFMSPKEICLMSKSKMIISYHTMSHKRINQLNYNQLKNDYINSTSFFKKNNIISTNYFSIPYGDQNSFTAENINQLKAIGYENVFTSEKTKIKSKILIDRIDCAKVNLNSTFIL